MTLDGQEPGLDRRQHLAQAGTPAHRRDTLLEMITEDLVAERIAIDSYRGFIRYLGRNDPTTRRMLETILAAEEEHADELADLLQELPADSK